MSTLTAVAIHYTTGRGSFVSGDGNSVPYEVYVHQDRKTWEVTRDGKPATVRDWGQRNFIVDALQAAYLAGLYCSYCESDGWVYADAFGEVIKVDCPVCHGGVPDEPLWIGSKIPWPPRCGMLWGNMVIPMPTRRIIEYPKI